MVKPYPKTWFIETMVVRYGFTILWLTMVKPYPKTIVSIAVILF